MSLKIIAISGKKDFYRIGKDFDNSSWYGNNKVLDIKVSKGDLVDIKFEKDSAGVNVLTEITVTGQAPKETETKTNSNWRSKSPAESESIRKQAVGKMVAETVKAIPGLSSENLKNIVKELFKVYDELTK